MIVLFLVLAILIAFIFYRRTLPEVSRHRRILLMCLRALFIFAVLLLLFNPILFIRQNYEEKPVMLLLSDHSESMKQIIAGQTKQEHLREFENTMREIAEENNYAVEYVQLFKDNPKQSILLDELAPQMQTNRDIRAIAIASDGWFADEPSHFRELVNTPIFTYNPQVYDDKAEILIKNVVYNKNARKNELQSIRVNIEAKKYDGAVDVTLSEKGRVLQKKTIEIVAAMPASPSISDETVNVQVNFDVRFTTTGLKVLEIEAKTNDDIDIASPNTEPVKSFAAIQVLDTKAKILILADGMIWEMRTFNRYLNFSDRFDTDLVYFHNGSFKQKGNTVNISWQDYTGFIVVSSATYIAPPSAAWTSAVNSIKNKVLNGSGLIYIGNISPAFEEILPSRISNINIVSEGQIALRSEALSYQIFREIEQHWNRFPPVQYHYLTAKEQSIVLAETTDQQKVPVLFLGHFGSGNVLHFAFNGLWKWQLANEDTIFDKFIGGLGQWIFSSNTDNFYAYTDKNIYFSGEKITVKLSAFDEKLNPLSDLNAKIVVTPSSSGDDIAPQHNEQQTSNTLFSDYLIKSNDIFIVNLPELPAGTYQYQIYDDINNRETKGEFEILHQDIQAESKGFNLRLLNDLSVSSAGRLLTADDLTLAMGSSPLIQKAEIIKKHRYIEIPLHKSGLFIVISLLIFCFELYLRKKWGLF